MRGYDGGGYSGRMNARLSRSGRRTPAFSATPPNAPDRTVRIGVVDDQPTVIAAMVSLLETESDFRVCGCAHSAEEARQLVANVEPDVLLVDVGLGAENGLELVRSLREDCRIDALIVSVLSETGNALPALRAGARGYLMKADLAEHLIEAVRVVLAGGVYLSADAHGCPGVAEAVAAAAPNQA